MSIGMSYDEYWYASSSLTKYYRKADRIRRNQRNEELWLQGYYNMIGFSVVMSRAFSKHSNAEYPKKPIEVYPKSESEIKADSIKNREDIIKSLSMFKTAWDKDKVNKNGS